MSHTSPASYMVWAIMSTLLGSFLLFHLWSFDRFRCLKWGNGPTSGTFKRVMTYSYLTSVPLIIIYSIGMATLKYEEGYTIIEGHGIIPTPPQQWKAANKAAIFPLQLLFSIGWSLEMVTHTEELCFWLFLVNSGHTQRDWFHSSYFRVWLVGSACALLYMPLLAIFTRSDPLESEAYIFLGGSLGSLCPTIGFLPILWTFPRFLSNLKHEGVDNQTLVRLTKFHELNTIRVVFRLLFTVPLLLLGVDGMRPHHHVNESALATDLLITLAALGCIVSSGITLTIFFPRSIEGEIAAKNASRDRVRSRTGQTDTRLRSFGTVAEDPYIYDPSQGHLMSTRSVVVVGSPIDDRKLDEEDAFSLHKSPTLPSSPTGAPPTYRISRETKLEPNRLGSILSDSDAKSPTFSATAAPTMTTATAPTQASAPGPIYTPNRRRTEAEGGGVEFGGVTLLTEDALRAHEQHTSHAQHILHNYRSPIDVAYASSRPRYGPRARGADHV